MFKNVILPACPAVLIFSIFFAFMVILTSCSSKEADQDNLIISYSDDLAGEIVESLLEKESKKLGLSESKDLGDCCGSYAQTALAAGEVDVCFMCPDAYVNMEDAQGKYRNLGTLIYGGDVLVLSPELKGMPSTIGYMNRRSRQEEVLSEYIKNSGKDITDITLQPMFPSALGFALECGYMEAIYVDALTALDLKLAVTPLDSDYATSIMVVSEEVFKNEKKAEKLRLFTDELNNMLKSLSDEDIMYDFISNHTEANNMDKKEVLEFWKSMNVRFGYLD